MFFRLDKILTASVASVMSFCIASSPAMSFQGDAPFQKARQEHKKEWGAEDKAIDARLRELKDKFGKRPNIIYILADDIGWGELGSFSGGAVRGTPTPNLDEMAREGMKFMSHYSEPSCTPTRLALLTGRHPVRTGVDMVLWPGNKQGLADGEVTVAEVLSDAGYSTAMFGKWHVGELEEHAPERQGFDYAYYGLYNGKPFSWATMNHHYSAEVMTGNPFEYDFTGTIEDYEKETGIDVPGIFEGVKGKGRKEVKPLGLTSMPDMERESIKRIKQYIRDQADADKPFFVYWASYAQQMAASPKEFRGRPGYDITNLQSAELAQHDDYMQQLLDTLREEGIAENTLVIWVSDNGPMYAFWPNSGYSWLRGQKGQVYEGGVRTPGFAWWPGTIKEEQTIHDMISTTDLFATAARIAGAEKKVPSDRVIDGIDQSALLLSGEGHGRRDYIFHYNGNQLGAVRMGDIKMHIKPQSQGGLPNVEVYNIIRDPAEKFDSMYQYLAKVVPFQRLIAAHKKLIEKYPHRKLESGEF